MNNLFYFFDRADLQAATTQRYRRFLKDAGYADIDNCGGALFGKYLLGTDENVDSALRRSRISTAVVSDVVADDQMGPKNYVVKINQDQARRLVAKLGGRLPTVGLMYGLFIPQMQVLEKAGSRDAKATLYEMMERKVEWLEDQVLNQSRVIIGAEERRLNLPDKDGRFNRADINAFGYPTSVNNQGEFYYWHPKINKVAAFRGFYNDELSLSLNWKLSDADEGIGIRLVKFL